MVGLSPDLFGKTRRILLKCPQFGSDSEVDTLFADPRLAPWRYHVPPAANRQARVQAVIAMLVDAASEDGDNALMLLVEALRDVTDSRDGRYAELAGLLAELVAALDDGPGSQVVKTECSSADAMAGASQPDLPALRRKLQRLDAVEIVSLCLDHFPSVYDKFSRGLQRDEMVNLLLDHCWRYPVDGARLAAILDDGGAVPPTPTPAQPVAPPEARVVQPLPTYRSITIRIFSRTLGASGTSGTPYPVELMAPGGRDFPRGQLTLDHDLLLSREADVMAYGEALGAMLFADAAVGQAYRDVLSVAQSHGEKLRVRLRLDAPELHDVRWERIQHPVGDTWLPVAATTDTLLSRYVPSGVWEMLQPSMGYPMHVLAVIASPDELGRYDLPQIGHDDRARWHDIFDDLPGTQVTYLESDTAALPTLPVIRRALLQGYPFVQFVCHGLRTQAGVKLALEREGGGIDWVGAGRLVEMLRGLPVSPRLCSLAACESGASDAVRGFAALGPALVAEGGVPVVVAMAEQVKAVTALRFTGQFFVRLLTHGVVDLAVHEARADVRELEDWSVPVLFSRLPKNRLFDPVALRG